MAPAVSASCAVHEVQVANDAASAKELPSCEARPGRRVNNSAAGKLQGGELREGVEGALERGSLLSTVDGLDTPLEVDTKIANALLGRPSSQRSLLAGTPASRRSKPPRPTRRCWPHTPRTPRSPPARASALASALPRRAASRAAVVTAFRRAAAILESTSEEVSTADCRA